MDFDFKIVNPCWFQSMIGQIKLNYNDVKAIWQDPFSDVTYPVLFENPNEIDSNYYLDHPNNRYLEFKTTKGDKIPQGVCKDQFLTSSNTLNTAHF